MSFSISLTVNGERRTVELDDPRTTLLDLLRERLHLTDAVEKGLDPSVVPLDADWLRIV